MSGRCGFGLLANVHVEALGGRVTTAAEGITRSRRPPEGVHGSVFGIVRPASGVATVQDQQVVIRHSRYARLHRVFKVVLGGKKNRTGGIRGTVGGAGCGVALPRKKRQ